jgi:ABC-type nitrate/sulfonate/bicarbonate transport system substrate-binding protein
MRKKLIYALVEAWREAENYYNNTDDNKWKLLISQIQESLKLTANEEEFLGELATSAGI